MQLSYILFKIFAPNIFDKVPEYNAPIIPKNKIKMKSD